MRVILTTPAAALRAAQIEMLRVQQWQSPYFLGAVRDARRVEVKL